MISSSVAAVSSSLGRLLLGASRQIVGGGRHFAAARGDDVGAGANAHQGLLQLFGGGVEIAAELRGLRREFRLDAITNIAAGEPAEPVGEARYRQLVLTRLLGDLGGALFVLLLPDFDRRGLGGVPLYFRNSCVLEGLDGRRHQADFILAAKAWNFNRMIALRQFSHDARHIRYRRGDDAGHPPADQHGEQEARGGADDNSRIEDGHQAVELRLCVVGPFVDFHAGVGRGRLERCESVNLGVRSGQFRGGVGGRVVAHKTHRLVAEVAAE